MKYEDLSTPDHASATLADLLFLSHESNTYLGLAPTSN